MQMTAGYKLVVIETGAEINSWGGTWGTMIDPPNPLILPNGDVVYAPEVEVDYGGYKLVPWVVDEPLPNVPESITRRQCALQLLSLNMITAEEALAMTKSGDVPAAIMAIFTANLSPDQVVMAQIDFAAANYYRDNSLLTMMGMTPEQVDQFFISAAKL